MWIIYRDPRNESTYIDKTVYGIVEDTDILAFQKKLAETLDKPISELNVTVTHLQPLVGSYFARKYIPMTQYTGIPVLPERLVPETMRVLQFPVAGRRNPYNI